MRTVYLSQSLFTGSQHLGFAYLNILWFCSTNRDIHRHQLASKFLITDDYGRVVIKRLEKQ